MSTNDCTRGREWTCGLRPKTVGETWGTGGRWHPHPQRPAGNSCADPAHGETGRLPVALLTARRDPGQRPRTGPLRPGNHQQELAETKDMPGVTAQVTYVLLQVQHLPTSSWENNSNSSPIPKATNSTWASTTLTAPPRFPGQVPLSPHTVLPRVCCLLLPCCS